MLTRDEIDQLLRRRPDLKHRAFLMVLYLAGLRFSGAGHSGIATGSTRLGVRARRRRADGARTQRVAILWSAIVKRNVHESSIATSR